jgi:hypothetical protein
LNARNVREEITVPRKIKKIHLTEWNLKSIANGVKSTLFIRRPNRAVAPIGRAPVSKTGCWGFESLQPCQN